MLHMAVIAGITYEDKLSGNPFAHDNAIPSRSVSAGPVITLPS
jgi:hypothetical protein